MTSINSTVPLWNAPSVSPINKEPLPFLDSQSLQEAILAQQSKLIQTTTPSLDPLPNGELPLHFAIRKGSLETVKSLLEKGCNFEERDSHGLAPIDHAMLTKNKEIQTLILSSLLNVQPASISSLINQVPTEESFSLYVSFKDRVQKATKFIANQCTPSRYANGVMAGTSDNQKVVKVLKAAELNVPPIFEAASKGDHKKIEALIAEGSDINAVMPNGWSPLYYAVHQQNFATVAFLLSKGAKINLSDKAGFSSIHLAAASNNVDILNLLLKQKANPFVKDKLEHTPLTYALSNKSMATAKVLASFSHLSTIDAEILYYNAQQQKNARDQLASSNEFFKRLLGLSIGVYFLMPEIFDPETALLMNCALTIIPTAIAITKTQGWKQKAAATALLAAEALPGVHIGVKLTAQAYRTWVIGKESFTTLKQCWQHRHLEVIRPLNNSSSAIINSAFSLFNIFKTAQGLDSIEKAQSTCEQLNMDRMDKARAIGQKTYEKINCEAFSKLDDRENFLNFYASKSWKNTASAWLSNMLGLPSSTESIYLKKITTGKVPLDICDGVNLQECITKGGLHASTDITQTMAILGLKEDFSLSDCKQAWKNLSLQYHPDKTKSSDSTVYEAVVNAKQVCEVFFRDQKAKWL